jgi:hypothetical protein
MGFGSVAAFKKFFVDAAFSYPTPGGFPQGLCQSSRQLGGSVGAPDA